MSLLLVGAAAKAGSSSLSACGFTATSCVDTRHTLRMLGQRRHRAVLCDIDIPGVDGMQFLHRVCAGFPEVAVIVVTGPGDLCGGILAMISGASGYIQAPFESENIAAKIGSALKRKHLESALRA